MKVIFIFTLIYYSNYLNNDWGSTGHRVVGEIAEQNISSKTRKKIFDLLNGNSIAYVSTYADEIKSDPSFKNYSYWHYANLKLNQKYKASQKNPKGDVYFGIKNFDYNRHFFDSFLPSLNKSFWVGKNYFVL